MPPHHYSRTFESYGTPTINAMLKEERREQEEKLN
jgi:hypothetical protein